MYDAPTNNYVNSNNYINTQTISYTQNNEEISTAINWMYSNGLTSFNTIGSFRPNDNLTREQASKFFAEFAEKIV
ncbi:MAG: S-layer homology domain-containing protein [Candidatus Paceibacterota bacterium]